MNLKQRIVSEEERELCEDNIRQLQAYMAQQLPDPAVDPEDYRALYSRCETYIRRNQRALGRYEKQKTDPTSPVAVHVARIGEIGFCTNRFELYMDFMHRVQARSPFTQTFVIQLAGDTGGTYLPSSRGAANKGYSASLWCNEVGHEGGQQWVEQTLEILNRMAAV